jgi:adenine-specific DNA-methyltransferase
MDGTSLTPEQEKLKALRQVLPEAFSEGKIDWEKLKATLGEDINFANERYVLNWAGKSDAFKVLQMPTTKTLIPAKDESVNFDETENIFIEGENFEVLKVLQKSYFGKVKMIYIDPPYNTGNDSFIYPDKFSESKADYEKRVGDKDEEGYMTKDGLFKKNSKENGQYHSNWLNMMMPRLYLAKNLLRPDGVIFVSIDDNEYHNLKMIMNEIFGEENFRNVFTVRRYDKNLNKQFIKQGLKTFNTGFEYILCYSKSESFAFNPVYKESSADRKKNGYWKGFWNDADRPTMRYDILGFTPESGQWKWKKETALEAVANYEEFLANHNDSKTIEEYWKETGETLKFIRRITTGKGKNKGVENWIAPSDGKLRNTNWTDLFASKHESETQGLFDYPKNIDLLSLLVESCCNSEDTIIDFFSGSGSTAHAILKTNAKDKGNRKCISVQLPEITDEKSDAFKLGYKTIAEISKERIRRAGKKIQEEINVEIKKIESEMKKLQGELPTDENKTEIENLKTKIQQLKKQDLGFKVLKLEDSNFKQWQQIEGKDAKALAEQMKLFVDPVSESATIENMVYELLLKSGKDLNSPIEKKGSFYKINNSEIILLLEKATQEIIDSVIAEKPIKVVALDKLFKGNDQLKTNAVLQMLDAGIEFKTI